MARTKAEKNEYHPSKEFLAIRPDASGNELNGLGETEKRRASPSFWHPADLHPFGSLAEFAAKSVRADPEARVVFEAANDHPSLAEITEEHEDKSAEQWTADAKKFAIENEADLFGAVPMQDHYIIEGFEIEEPYVITLGFAHDYDQLKQLPSSPDNNAGTMDIAQQYARGTRSSFALANWIRSRGFNAHAYPGPRAAALLLVPPSLDAGFGELGKHGSIINRSLGSGFRLAAVTTDMPLVFTQEDHFGADDFCTNCQVCTKGCPPGAISDDKQMVRGVEKYYVDFDKCIPFFAENSGCGICIAVCPWTRPGVADTLITKMAKRKKLDKGG